VRKNTTWRRGIDMKFKLQVQLDGNTTLAVSKFVQPTPNLNEGRNCHFVKNPYLRTLGSRRHLKFRTVVHVLMPNDPDWSILNHLSVRSK
jgi:hypothetical protein